MDRHPLYIDGAFVESTTGRWFDTEDPYTEQAWAQVARADAQDVDRAVQAAHRAFSQGPWPALTPSQRGLLLYRLADLIERDARALAELEVRDNGKLMAEMHGQTQYLPQWFRYFGGLADKIEGAVIPLDKKGYLNMTRHEPVGVVAIITPWNSPLMLLGWKLAPALAAGCTVVIKPSEFTSVSTLALMRLFDEAGFPPGVVNVVTGFGHELGEALVTHPLVRKISFTGSDATGRLIAEQAGRHLKSVNLELGGKSPNIIFDDADLDDALNGVASGIFAAAGQTCIAGSRLLLHERIHDAFVERVADMARQARLGPPMHADTQIGPICTRPQHEKILGFIDQARAEGGELLAGGQATHCPQSGTGRFVQPTVFTGVQPTHRLAREEVFGPVLAVLRFRDEDEAVARANDTRFGLGAGVWTRDIARAVRMSERIQSGTVWVNTYRAVSYMSPFGGMKDSGLGRENGQQAIFAYLQTKSVWLAAGAVSANPFVMR